MNPKPVVLRDRALSDFAQAVDYYSLDVSPQVARSFAAGVQEAFQHLSRFPASGSRRYGRELNLPDLRSWPVTGFPYLVLYVENEFIVDVYRVLHTARDISSALTEGTEA